MESKLRIFGGKDDDRFWSDKPISKNHPLYQKKVKWYHVHWYTIPYNPRHKSPDGLFEEVMKNVQLYKCRCGRLK